MVSCGGLFRFCPCYWQGVGLWHRRRHRGLVMRLADGWAMVGPVVASVHVLTSGRRILRTLSGGLNSAALRSLLPWITVDILALLLIRLSACSNFTLLDLLLRSSFTRERLGGVLWRPGLGVVNTIKDAAVFGVSTFLGSLNPGCVVGKLNCTIQTRKVSFILPF